MGKCIARLGKSKRAWLATGDVAVVALDVHKKTVDAAVRVNGEAAGH